jgi:hypothetical protein
VQRRKRQRVRGHNVGRKKRRMAEERGSGSKRCALARWLRAVNRYKEKETLKEIGCSAEKNGWE